MSGQYAIWNPGEYKDCTHGKMWQQPHWCAMPAGSVVLSPADVEKVREQAAEAKANVDVMVSARGWSSDQWTARYQALSWVLALLDGRTT